MLLVFARCLIDSPHDTFCIALQTALARWDLSPSTKQLDQTRRHYELLLEANRTINLTRITTPLDAAIKHYADSLALLAWAGDQRIEIKSVLDIGTGAGFPAIPLAIMRPDWNVTAIDGTKKKIEFVRTSAAAIGLTNLTGHHAHSTHWKPNVASTSPDPDAPVIFDLVVFRALARLEKAVELATPFLKPGGWLVAYQTTPPQRRAGELTSDAPAEQMLQPSAPFQYDLELGDEILTRTLCVYRKRSA